MFSSHSENSLNWLKWTPDSPVKKICCVWYFSTVLRGCSAVEVSVAVPVWTSSVTDQNILQNDRKNQNLSFSRSRLAFQQCFKSVQFSFHPALFCTRIDYCANLHFISWTSMCISGLLLRSTVWLHHIFQSFVINEWTVLWLDYLLTKYRKSLFCSCFYGWVSACMYVFNSHL